MAQNVDFILNLNGDQARKVLLDLHRQGNTLFSKNGYQLNLDSKGFNRSLDQATNRVLSFTAATTVLASVGTAMRRLATDAISVETAISKIQSILQATSSDLNSFTSSLFDLANKTGLGFTDAAMAAEEFSRQGLSLEKTLKATEAAMSLARVSGGNLTKTVGDLVAISSAFGNEALAYSEVADTLGALDAAFSTTTTGLAEGLARVASIANDVGVSFTEMSALIAATKQVTGRSEAVIGNAFKSIFTNIGTDKVQEELRAIGVETRNLDGSFIDAEKILQNLAKAYENLTDAQQANITFKVAGKYNKNVLQGAIFAQNQGVSQKALDVANNAGGSIAERLATLNDTTETSIQRLQNAVTQLATTNIGGIFTDAIKGLSDFASNAATTLGSIFEKENPVGKALAAGISGVLGGPVLILGGALILKLIKKIGTDLFNATKSVIGMNSGFASSQGLLKGITSQLSSQVALMERLAALSGRVYGAGASGRTGATTMASSAPYGPNPLGGGRFLPNNSPIIKPDRADPKYRQSISLTAQPTSSLPRNYLRDMSNYNAQVSTRAAQNKAGSSAYAREKLSREGAYSQTARQGGFFGIAKREKEFARSQGVSENKQVVKDRIAQSRADRSQTIRGGAFGASFLAPLIGSAVGQAIGGKGGRIAESAGQGLGIAAVGLAIGGIAAPIAAAVGGFKLLSTITEELFGNFKDLNVKLTDEILQKQKEGKAGEAYLQAQFDFNKALEDGDQNLIERSRKNLATAGSSLTGDFTSLLSITDPEKLASAYEKLTESSERAQSAILSMVNANDLAEKSYNGFEKALSLFGYQKTLNKADAKPLVDSVVGSIDLSKITKAIPVLQSNFIQTGESSGIKDVISSLVPNFEILTTNFEGGSEALALLVFEALAAKDATKKFSDAQAKLAISTRQLTANFEKAISRSFEATSKKNERTTAGLNSRIAATAIFGGGGSEMQQIQESYAKSLAEISISASEEQLGSKVSTKIGIAQDLKESAKSSGEQANVSKFLEKFTKEDYNINNIQSDLKSFGIDELTIKSITKSMEGFTEELDKSRTKADLARVSLKALTDAQLKKAKDDALRNTFGDLNADQSEAISSLSAGKAAERAFNERKRKETPNKKATLTEAEADAIRKADEDQKALGREGAFSDPIRILATKTKAEQVNQRQGSSIIGDEITNLLSGDQFKYQNKSSKDLNVLTGKKIQASVLKGDFMEASKMVSNLIGVKDEDRANLQDKIVAESERNLKAGPLANLETENAQNLKNIAEYTRISATADKEIEDLVNITPKEVSLSDQTKGFERDSKIAELTKSLEKSNADLKKIADDRLKMQGDRSTIENVIGNALKAPDTARYSNYSDMAGPQAGERQANLVNNKINEQEAGLLREAYSMPGNLQDKEAFLKEKLPQGRFEQLSKGVLQKLPSLDTNLNLSPLDQQESKIKSDQKQKETEKKALEDSQKKTEDSARSFEVSAAAIQTAAELFAKGTVQNINTNANVNVAVTGPFNTPKATEELASTFKRLYIQYEEESKGVTPVLAPSTATV
jgi:TP901 family phage tail tape measure protein